MKLCVQQIDFNICNILNSTCVKNVLFIYRIPFFFLVSKDMTLLVEEICSQLTSLVIARCKALKIFTVNEFLSQNPENLSKRLEISYKDTLLINDALLLKFAPFPQRADSVISKLLESIAIFTTGSERINQALKGGIYTNEVTEVHGPSGSGKTQFCFDVVSNVLIETPCTVLFMDSNCSFSSERVKEILLQKSDGCIVPNEKLQKIKVVNIYDCYNFLDILSYVKDELQKKVDAFYMNLKLLVIDSITPLLAPCFGGNFLDGMGIMNAVAEMFNFICSKHFLSILVCNSTVQSNSSEIKPALGSSWKYVPSVSLCIQKINESTQYKMTAVKTCRTCLIQDVPFSIGKAGLSN